MRYSRLGASFGRRPPVLFISWAFVQGRCQEIAEALGGRAESIYLKRISDRRLAPIRYLVSALITAWVLVRDRPRSVIVTNPPIFPGLVAFGFARLCRIRVVLDSHPASFGRKGDAVSAKLLPVHRWLARRTDAVMVTAGEWVDEVEAWGGHGLIVHEAPPPWTIAPAEPIGERPRVLFVGVFAGDEPVAEMVDAARQLSDCDVVITGDVRKAPAGMLAGAPPNVDFVGFLDMPDYVRQLERADLVVSLTTEPTSVMRSAYEAVYGRRPLVTSDWPLLHDLFPFAVHVVGTAEGIAAGVRAAVARRADLVDTVERALVLQEDRWRAQLDELRRVLRIEAEGDPTQQPMDRALRRRIRSPWRR